MAQITEKILEIKTKIEGAKTVNDYKEQIAALVTLMDKLDKESYEYHQTVEMLVDAEEELTNVMKVGKSQLSAQEGSYNALVNRMAALKKAHKAVTDDFSRNKLSEEINSINTQLKDMDAKNGVYVRNVGDYENAVKKALKTPQQELKALRTQLAQLTEGTDEYNAVFTRMAQLTHDVTEQQEQLKWASSDLGDILGNVAGVATSLAGGFSAFNALSGLLGGGESEELEKAMLQAQRFIQLIQGLEQLEQLADKISGLWKGIKNFSKNTQTAAITLTDFNNKTKTANATMANAANTTFTTATATAQAAESTGKLANSQKELNQTETAYIENLEKLLTHHREMLAEEQQELIILEQKLSLETELDERTRRKIDNTKREIDFHEEKIKHYEKEISSIRKDTDETKENTKSKGSNTAVNELNHKGLKKWLATKILESKQRQLNAETLNDEIARINALTSAQLLSEAATVAWTGALKMLKTALVSTGIGLIIVALGSLLSQLGKGLGSLWSWISGAEKAKEITNALAEEIEHLNNMLDINERFWSRREALLKAQGATEEELYQEERKAIEAKLKRVQALLAENEAIAANIGAKKLQKDKYEEFRETLEELREQEKELRIELEDFDWDNYCSKIEKARKENEKRAEEQKKAAEKAKEAHDKEKESAENLYKQLIEHYKDEKTKLKEKYEQQKALLEKYGKDTTNLTKKYEEDKTKIVLKEEEESKKLREQFNKDFDATFRNPSLEYFNNELENAKEKLEDFKAINDTIKVDEQGFMSAENWGDSVKYLSDTYGMAIQSMEHFHLVMKKVIMDYEDAKKALEEYQKQQAKDKSDKIVEGVEKEVEAINESIDAFTELADVEHRLEMSKSGYNNNYITQMKARWETEDAIFNMRKIRIEKEIELYKALSKNSSVTEEARVEALRTANELERQLLIESTEHIIKQNERKKEATENYVTTVQDSLDGISTILSNVASAWETNIQAQVDSGEISEEEGEKRLDEMKDLQSAMALINALSSAVSAFNSLASIPFVGVALGTAAAATALASGLAQVKAIQAVKKGDSSTSTKYAEVTPTVNPSDYNPQATTNVTNGDEREYLNNLTNKPLRAYVVESEITSSQQRVAKRNEEATF